jgi:hypothetical protein
VDSFRHVSGLFQTLQHGIHPMVEVEIHADGVVHIPLKTGMLEVSDEKLLSSAAVEGRAMVTRNKDLLR